MLFQWSCTDTSHTGFTMCMTCIYYSITKHVAMLYQLLIISSFNNNAYSAIRLIFIHKILIINNFIWF